MYMVSQNKISIGEGLTIFVTGTSLLPHFQIILKE